MQWMIAVAQGVVYENKKEERRMQFFTWFNSGV